MAVGTLPGVGSATLVLSTPDSVVTGAAPKSLYQFCVRASVELGIHAYQLEPLAGLKMVLAQ